MEFFSDSYKRGILMQGRISEWTADIVREYQKNFPYAHILISTWTTENVDNIPCDVIQVEPPEPTYPHSSTVNYQIIGARAGLKKMQSDIIMKCRTDQFIHNRHIFKIFDECCSKNKIMIPDLQYKLPDHYLSDFCQVATRDVLCEFWNSLPLYDGSTNVWPERYFTKNYVQFIKKDKKPWKTVVNEYFCIKRQDEDFKIEWEKYAKYGSYQKGHRNAKSRDYMKYDEFCKFYKLKKTFV